MSMKTTPFKKKKLFAAILVSLGILLFFIPAQDTAEATFEYIAPTTTYADTVFNNSYTVNTSLGATNSTSLIDWNNSLVGWWRFNEQTGTIAQDHSTYANNGTLHNMNTGINNGSSGHTTSGKFGNALNFDGVNDYVNTIDTSISDDGTIELWFNTDGLNTGDRMLQKGGGARPIIEYSGELDNVLFDCYNGSNHFRVYSTSNVNEGEWIFIAVTWKKDDKISMFYNGINEANTSINGGIEAQAYPFVFGRCGTQDANYFNGTIDEVKIYNRVLSSDEIEASYNAGLYRLYHNFTSLEDKKYTYTSYNQDTDGVVTTLTKKTVLIDAKNPYDQDHNSSLVLPITSYPIDEATGLPVSDVFDNFPMTINDGVWNTTGICNTSSIKFSGAGGHSKFMSIPHNTNLSFTGENFTIELWTNFHYGNDCELMSKGDADDGYRFRKYTDNKLYFYIPDAANNYRSAVGDTAITLNDWVMVNGVYNSTHLMIYVDGVLDGITAYTDGVKASTTVINIGTGTIWWADCNVSISLLRFYDEALNSSIIQEHYDNPCRENTISSYITVDDDEEDTSTSSSAPTYPAHCTDGYLSGDEAGTDCGGSCPNSCPPFVQPKPEEPEELEEYVALNWISRFLDELYHAVSVVFDYIRIGLRGFLYE